MCSIVQHEVNKIYNDSATYKLIADEIFSRHSSTTRYLKEGKLPMYKGRGKGGGGCFSKGANRESSILATVC